MKHSGKRVLLRMAPILTIGLLGILIAAPSASGQAALEQYVPSGNPAGGPHGGGTLDNPYPVPPAYATKHKAVSNTQPAPKRAPGYR